MPNAPDAYPPEIEQVGPIPFGPIHGGLAPAVTAQYVSFVFKPVAAKPTDWPCPWLAGFNTNSADGVPTVKTPVADDPVLSVICMPYVPGNAVPGTTTEPDTCPIPGEK